MFFVDVCTRLSFENDTIQSLPILCSPVFGLSSLAWTWDNCSPLSCFLHLLLLFPPVAPSEIDSSGKHTDFAMVLQRCLVGSGMPDGPTVGVVFGEVVSSVGAGESLVG